MTKEKRSSDVSRHLARLALRLRADAEYMASVLAAYQARERLDDDALAEWLGVPAGMLARLALCRRPRSDGPDFAEQVRQVAAYTSIDAGQLAQLVRQTEALETMRDLAQEEAQRQPASQPAPMALGWLAAARDRDETEEGQPEGTDEDSDQDEVDSE